MENSNAVNFNLNLFIDSHPIMSCVIVLIITSLICLFLFGVYKLISNALKKGGKFGPVDIPADSTINKVIDKASGEAEQKIIKDEIKLVNCLAFMISTAVKHGFEKSTKRQELFDKQTYFTKSRYNGIIGSIVIQYIGGEKNSSIMKYVEMVLDYIFKEAVYIPMEKIYKADKLTEKPKEELIEEHRSFIDTIGENVLRKAADILYNGAELTEINNNLINALKNKQDEIKKAAIDSLNKAHDYAEEQMEQLIKLQEELNTDLNNHLKTCLGTDIDKLTLPKNWNDDLPPNEIIGEVR